MPALLAGPLVRYLILGGVLIVMGFAIWHYRNAAIVARDAQAVAERSAEIAAADAARWQAAAEERGRLIESQNAAIEARRADLARARQVIADAEAAARQARQAAETQIRQWRERSRANPDQAVPLGPIARDAVRVLVQPVD
jgi:hypothetical protein